MTPMSGPTGVQHTELTTSPNVAYKMVKQTQDNSSLDYAVVDRMYPPVKPSTESQGDGRYVIPVEGPSQGRIGGTQGEIVHERVSGDQSFKK